MDQIHPVRHNPNYMLSSEVPLIRGVSLGFVCCPCVFLIYINNIPENDDEDDNNNSMLSLSQMLLCSWTTQISWRGDDLYNGVPYIHCNSI